jgi:hypothetical protein
MHPSPARAGTARHARMRARRACARGVRGVHASVRGVHAGARGVGGGGDVRSALRADHVCCLSR